MRLACAVAIAAAALRPAIAGPASPQQQIALIAKPSVMRVMGAYVASFQIPPTTLTPGGKVQESIGGSGTGFFITADGYIATNAHVVASIHDGDAKAREALTRVLYKDLDQKIGAKLNRLQRAALSDFISHIELVELKKLAYVVLPNGDHLDYEIKQFGAAGTGRDCAVLKIKTGNAPSLPIGDSSRSQVEDPIVVLGYPGVADFEGLLDEKSQLEATVTDGAISSLKRAASGEPILQISAPITHGNSGGPLFDAAGRVIGINSVIGTLSEDQASAGNVGLAFAIPINHARRIATDIINTGKARRTVMGVQVDTSYQNPLGGARLSQVEAGGPAESGGLKSGDVVMAVNGKPIEESWDLTALVRKYAPGDTVEIQYLRGTARAKASVTLVADAK
jgi:S1-C subfamily serine protease